ncbi:MAG TPA: trypsin-like peptidase domain-containing protein, partial [Thermoanaerobaculia bacterium]|nr:trypsin-like peptidase domain-containing protein [Thermoanaerobaculia bacterium]
MRTPGFFERLPRRGFAQVCQRRAVPASSARGVEKMERLARIGVLTITCGLSGIGMGAPPIGIQLGSDDRVGPASIAEPGRASDARFALFRSEPMDALLVAELADSRVALPDEITKLRDDVRSGRTPTRNGFTRELPAGLAVDLVADASASARRAAAPGLLSVSESGAISWAGAFRAKGAWALRILLTNVAVPPGTRFLVCGKVQADCTSFGPEAVTERAEIWSPIVEGDTIHLEVSVPSDSSGAAGGGFVPSSLMEIVSPDLLAADLAGPATKITALDTSCMANGECVSDATLPDLSKYRSAYAHLQYVENGSNYICSGALVNDDGVDGFIPYLLTANHCFDGQASASSLVSYFDYRYSSCSGGRPSLATLPKVYGATLLATGSSSDFTFLRLSSNPSGYRTYLGWDARGIASGATLYRLSHPYGWPQYFSTGQYLSSPSNYCSSLPPSRFAYSNPTYGGTAGGSSGSPVLLTGGYIVGQLYGGCGSGDLKDPCDPRNMDVDGSFASTWSTVWQWLRPAAAGSKPVPDFGYS